MRGCAICGDGRRRDRGLAPDLRQVRAPDPDRGGRVNSDDLPPLNADTLTSEIDRLRSGGIPAPIGPRTRPDGRVRWTCRSEVFALASSRARST
jgi:hypothetical protein